MLLAVMSYFIRSACNRQVAWCVAWGLVYWTVVIAVGWAVLINPSKRAALSMSKVIEVETKAQLHQDRSQIPRVDAVGFDTREIQRWSLKGGRLLSWQRQGDAKESVFAFKWEGSFEAMLHLLGKWPAAVHLNQAVWLRVGHGGIKWSGAYGLVR